MALYSGSFDCYCTGDTYDSSGPDNPGSNDGYGIGNDGYGSGDTYGCSGFDRVSSRSWSPAS